MAVYNPQIIDVLRKGHFELLSSSTKAQLEEMGALISQEVDEINLLKEQIKSIDNDDKVFHLMLNPTLDCNLHCWYCYESHIRETTMTETLIESIKKLVNNRIKENANLSAIYISFFGGEPLLAFNSVVNDFLDWIQARCSRAGIKLYIHFTSNGVKINKEIISVLKQFNCAFQITLDGGKSDHDKVRFEKGGIPTYNRIVKNICDLINSGINVVVRVNYTQHNINSVADIIKTFRDATIVNPASLTFDFNKVWQDVLTDAQELKISELLQNYRNELRNMGFIVSNCNLLDSVRNSCYADKTNEILINYNGDIFACTARDFIKENRKGILCEDGNIKWLDPIFPDRSKSKMTKSICCKCRIAPICGGGCHQKNIEGAVHKSCNIGLTERKIDNLILERFEEYFM